MATAWAVCSNRGGVGKSSLVAQLAPAIALKHPDKQVLLLDLSIQGDSSVFTLGGVAEPSAFQQGVRTLGGERMASLGTQNAFNFLAAARAFPAAAAGAPGGIVRSFWRGTTAPAASNSQAAFPWTSYAVKAVDLHPEGGAPPNLWISAGGHALHGTDFAGLAAGLRAAFDTMQNTVIIIDTDAELSERGASLAGIAAADSLALIVSASWPDYLRALDDPANSFFAALKYLTESVPGFRAKIRLVIANGVQKTRNGFCSMLNVPNLLPFTPMSLCVESLNDIFTHLYSTAVDPNINYARFFFNPAQNMTSVETFGAAFVSAVPTVVEGVWQRTWRNGRAICVKPWADEPHVAAGTAIEAVASRFNF
jgi:hypothetical protein